MPLFDGIKALRGRFLLAISIILCIGSGAIAEDAAWHISKSSGDVWVISSGAQQVALTNDASFKPGDEIRTGRNGRVLLVRGQESILVSPNSVISLPPEETEQKDGLSTTILQQAGSILLEVEKRAVKHFEVETPYLAAVVKGTQFRVSVNKDDSSVDVLRGEVEVAGFKSGQYTTVRPGQAARVATEGRGDLSLSGSGTLSPIQQGEPHQSSIAPIPVPQEGLSAPASAPDGQQVRVVPPLGEIGSSAAPSPGPAGLAPRASGTSGPIQQSQFRQSSADPPPGLKQGVSVAGGTPSGQQVRIAAAPGGVEAYPVRSEASAADESADEDANENTWGFGLFGWGNDKASGHKKHLDNKEYVDQRTISLVLGIGIAVAVATGVTRRMQKPKQTQRRKLR